MSTASSTAENSVQEVEVNSLTAFDRCDACGAQAYVRVTVHDSELLFCAHHANKHQEKLSEIAEDWHDETDRLYEQA